MSALSTTCLLALFLPFIALLVACLINVTVFEDSSYVIEIAGQKAFAGCLPGGICS